MPEGDNPDAQYYMTARFKSVPYVPLFALKRTHQHILKPSKRSRSIQRDRQITIELHRKGPVICRGSAIHSDCVPVERYSCRSVQRVGPAARTPVWSVMGNAKSA